MTTLHDATEQDLIVRHTVTNCSKVNRRKVIVEFKDLHLCDFDAMHHIGREGICSEEIVVQRNPSVSFKIRIKLDKISLVVQGKDKLQIQSSLSLLDQANGLVKKSGPQWLNYFHSGYEDSTFLCIDNLENCLTKYALDNILRLEVDLKIYPSHFQMTFNTTVTPTDSDVIPVEKDDENAAKIEDAQSL